VPARGRVNSEAVTTSGEAAPSTCPAERPSANHGDSPKHDVKPGLMRLRDEEKTVTWDSARKRSRPNRRLLLLLLALPFLLGSLGAAPTAPTAHADDLSEARARQSQLKKQIAAQQRQIARLNGLQRDLSNDIAATKSELKSINADLVAVKKRITRMKKKIEEVKAAYAALLERGAELDAELTKLQAEEAAAAASLADRKAELAQRIRSAYDTDRTSLLETFLSGGSFTDILAEASYMIDVGEQDKALAQQIERDQAALEAVHQTVEDTRLATEKLRVETAAQKKKLDKAMRDLKREQKKLRALERAAERELARQKAAYEKMAKNKKGLKKAIARAQASQRALAKRIDKIIAAQRARGNIPSQYNGSFRWPLVGRISGEFGCSSYPGYAPGYGCAHFHNGIDIVAAYGLGIVVPLAALWFGTSAIGDLVEDRLLVYLWLKPIPRWQLPAAAILATSSVLAGPGAPDRLTVRFLDVGQGDAVLIQHPDGTAVLFDGGPPEGGVVRLLRRAGVDRLALVVATHDMDVVAELCSRVVVVDGGRIAADGPARELLADVVEGDSRLAWRGAAVGLAHPAGAGLALEDATYVVVDLETTGLRPGMAPWRRATVSMCSGV